MNNLAVTDQDLQDMLDNGAQHVAANYAVFRRSFTGATVYMSELGMTDIIMAYGQDWANQHQKNAVWTKTGNEKVTGSDFHVRRKTGVNTANQNVFETVYFQAKIIKTNTTANREYADFIWTSASDKFQNLLLQDYVAKENAAGRPSRGYYICYGPNGVTYVAVQKIGLFIDMRVNTHTTPNPTTDVAWNIGAYGGRVGGYGGLARNTMAAATNMLVN
ncbi:hypothetical protein K505DRAFT_375191 [Melanomma pulvis-pyrius CBS 109.77]|uniref:Uncharacterized protein n=1 Tax=Melanomma pulvis-pyrius CBS 109.77 TaxID=1314802 RepID=A0A6A6XD90_9PLEO|nr:hypothetical protein K505DRAFT_375191 [Melanomma pulvis-pyrius CBS 109.77]